jgi:drug/metabolite transporter (DMT)-like permease
VTGADWLRLTGLAACWGLAFVFIRVAVPALGPYALVELRTLIACALLLAYAWWTGARLELRHRWRHYLLLGALGSAIPFCLIAFAQTVQTASYSVLVVALAPLFSALVATLWTGEPFGVRKGAGLVLGLAGVALLIGWKVDRAAMPPAWAIGLTLLAALFYGIAGVYTKRHLAGASAIGAAAGSQLGAALVLLPPALLAMPPAVPGLLVWLNVLALALLSSALAFILYFRLIASIGPVRTVSVNYLTPLFGVGGGVVLLGESVTPNMVAGAALIFAGLGLVMRAPAMPAREGRA